MHSEGIWYKPRGGEVWMCPTACRISTTIGPRRFSEFTETFPTWSPDGGQIAFIRDNEGIFLVPSERYPSEGILGHIGRLGAGREVSDHSRP